MARVVAAWGVPLLRKPAPIGVRVPTSTSLQARLGHAPRSAGVRSERPLASRRDPVARPAPGLQRLGRLSARLHE